MVRVKSRRLLCSLFLLPFIYFPGNAAADITSNCSISPNSATLLDGSIPPQEGVEIFVYSTTQTGVQYTFQCDVSEQPASVVVLPAQMNDVTYDGSGGTLSVVFTNTDYLEGTNIPAPPGTTTFSIAVIAASEGEDGIPTQMRGSWMATNIPPFGLDVSGAGGWELLPPDEEDPFFGYRLNGPEETTGFFTMFIPEAMLDLFEELSGEEGEAPPELSWEDLAVFNDDQQASLEITPQQGGGALVDIFVEFDEGVGEFPEDNEADAAVLRHSSAANGPPSSGGVDKRVTVGEAASVSLAANESSPVKKETVKLFGWVQDCQPGDSVKLTSNAVGKKAKKKGKKAFKKYKKKGWKTVQLDAECKYEFSFTAKRNDVVRALYKPAGQKPKKSGKLKIKVSKR